MNTFQLNRRQKLARFINHTITELVIGILIIISIILTVLEVTHSGGSQQIPRAYEWASHVITAIFIVELSIRWYTIRSTGKFFRQYWFDVIAVIPIARPLRILRVLRLLRLVRLGILLMRRTRKLASVLTQGLAENLLIVVILAVVFLIGGIGIMIAERGNPDFARFGDALWWSLYTLMAGEPIGGEAGTPLGKAITVVVMLGGFTVFAMFTGVVSAVMVARLRGGVEAKEMELEELTNHYVICGWNRSVPTLIRELQQGVETRFSPIVIAAELEQEPELPGAGINRGLIFFVRGDFTSASVLQQIRVQYAKAAILPADKSRPRSDQDRDARTILAALTIEKMAADRVSNDMKGGGILSVINGNLPGHIYTCVELLQRDQNKVRLLRSAAVEDIIDEDEYVGHLIAHSVRAYGLVQVLDELLTTAWGSHFSRQPTERPMTFQEALTLLKHDQDTLAIGVIHTSKDDLESITYELNPPAEYLIGSQDDLVVIRPPGDRLSSPIQDQVIHAGTILRPECPIVICGYNRTSVRIIRELHANEQTRSIPIRIVSEIESCPEPLQAILRPGIDRFISGDYVDTDVLTEADVPAAQNVILLADKSKSRSDQDRDARTILAALTVERLNSHTHTCAELLNRDGEKVQVLDMANVDDIVVGDEYAGTLMAHSSRTYGLIQVLDELLASGVGNDIYKLSLPAGMEGQTYSAVMLNYKRKYNGIVFAVETAIRPQHPLLFTVERPEEADEPADRRYYVTNPPSDFKCHRGDNLFVITRKPHQAEVLN